VLSLIILAASVLWISCGKSDEHKDTRSRNHTLTSSGGVGNEDNEDDILMMTMMMMMVKLCQMVALFAGERGNGRET